MFQFANVSDLEIKRIIRERMRSAYDFDHDEFFDDIAKIGSLLSSEIMCVAYSRHLNDALIEYAKDQGVFKKMTAGGQALTTPWGSGAKRIEKGIPSTDNFNLIAERHKHHKVLSGFLTAFEAEQGFNEGAYSFESRNKFGALVTLTTTPGKPVTLPGSVDATPFRQNLLGKARHFKDPSVGSLHGEFTHQIQWYIVCEYARLTKQLQNRPADIFKACARPQFCNDPVNISVWDLVFEGSGAFDFRSPERLTEFFLRVSREDHRRHKELWFLAALIEGRYAKREIEKAEA
jgi:hypothetical protein